MRLTTVQNEEIYEQVMSKGIACVDEKYMQFRSPHIRKAYIEITKIAKKHISKEFDKFPFWCSYNEKYYTNLYDNQVRIVLEVPEEYVLLSDYDKWVEYVDTLVGRRGDFLGLLRQEYYREIFNLEKALSIQAIIPYIKKEWVIDVQRK